MRFYRFSPALCSVFEMAPGVASSLAEITLMLPDIRVVFAICPPRLLTSDKVSWQFFLIRWGALAHLFTATMVIGGKVGAY